MTTANPIAPGATVPVEVRRPSSVDWAAILAGAAFALALSFVLYTFGAAIGLSMASPLPGADASPLWFAIAAGIWFIWVSVSCFGAGGYLAGRLRRRAAHLRGDEVEMRDGAHGLLVWAIGALVGAMLAGSGVSGIVGTASNAAGSVVGAAGTAAASGSGPAIDYYTNVMARGGDGEADLGEAARGEIVTILQRSVAQGEVVERDRAYLAQLVQNQTELDADAARAQVDGVIAEVDKARQTALETAEAARIAGIVAAFVIAATLLVSAATAFFAAGLGGKHRDEHGELTAH